MRKLDLDSTDVEVKIGGLTVNKLRYADGTTLLAENEEDLKDLIPKLMKEREKMGLYLSVKKTKVMTTVANGKINLKINDKEIESVQDFIFLGSKINHDGKSILEIKCGITLGRNTNDQYEQDLEK